VFSRSAPNLTGVRTLAGDYNEKDLASATDTPELVANIVTTWMQHGADLPTILFAVDRAHAKNLQQEFIANGIVAAYVDAYTEAHDRTAIADRFQAGEVKVVCSVGCLTTGVDWDIRCIIMARPTKSEMLFVQMIGRGLRTAPGKTSCLILDHSDNHLRLGFVTDIHHDELDDGTVTRAPPKPKEALPKKCPKCTFLKPPKTLVCPACGFAPRPKCDVVNQDGELVEFKSRNVAIEPSEQERQAFYAELRQVGADRGYKSGWAAVQYKNKHGAYPPWKWNDHKPRQPSRATLSWIRSRQIAYAKATQGASYR
jgi:superfamily II DNA or RNA helicase